MEGRDPPAIFRCIQEEETEVKVEIPMEALEGVDLVEENDRQAVSRCIQVLAEQTLMEADLVEGSDPQAVFKCILEEAEVKVEVLMEAWREDPAV